MPQRINFIYLLLGLLVLRLISMIWVPFADPTEARYGEIARLMVTSNDWITPWFEPNVPFWGKPPLSFWLQALSFKLLGVNEFAARLPSWLATWATIGLLWQLASVVSVNRVAKNALIIYLSCALVYIASGAVLTDPFLVLGTTWSMVAFYLSFKQPVWWWRYGFFVGLAIGLLAKGPLALVLVFGPLTVWFMLSKKARTHTASLPWLSGMILTLVMSLPWYIAAELKTPGFLNYFIVGEHFLRFLDPGWAGDLYGKAHKAAKGMIWVQWLMATFPWGIVALIGLIIGLSKAKYRGALRTIIQKPIISYLLLWALFTPVFFTVSGNILWTYLLPALPAFSLLLAMAFEHKREEWRSLNKYLTGTFFFVPVVTLLAGGWLMINPNLLKTEQGLINSIATDTSGRQEPDPENIYYLGSRLPFSARFYSEGRAKLISLDKLKAAQIPLDFVPLAIPHRNWNEVKEILGAKVESRYENRRYVLVDYTGSRLEK